MFSPLVDVFGDQEVIRLFSEESLVQVQTEAAEEVLRALTGEPLRYGVNERELQRT